MRRLGTYIRGWYSPDSVVVGAHKSIGYAFPHITENPFIKSKRFYTWCSCSMIHSLDEPVHAFELEVERELGQVVLIWIWKVGDQYVHYS
jgi:hypothetical protein